MTVSAFTVEELYCVHIRLAYKSPASNYWRGRRIYPPSFCNPRRGKSQGWSISSPFGLFKKSITATANEFTDSHINGIWHRFQYHIWSWY